MNERYLINSILRAGGILKCLSTERASFKISGVARRLHLDRSTTYRILLSLEKCGFVEKDEKTGEYALGLGAFEIGSAYLRGVDLARAAKPFMDALSLKVQETVHLAILSGTEILYLDKVDSPRSLGVISKIGQRGPVHCTALGKVLLAFLPAEERLGMMDQIRFQAFTPRTITSEKKLTRELDQVQRQGFALDNREIEEDVECIAAPIRDHLGKVIAALSVSGPQKKIGTFLERRVVKEVRNAASLISSRLGYLGGLEKMPENKYSRRKER